MALTLIFAILGALVGYINGETVGAIAGGLLGAMAMQMLNIREELQSLRLQLAQVQKTLTSPSAIEPASNKLHQQTAQPDTPKPQPAEAVVTTEPIAASVVAEPLTEPSPPLTPVAQETTRAFAYTPIPHQRVYQPEEIAQAQQTVRRTVEQTKAPAQHKRSENLNANQNGIFEYLQNFLMNGNPLVKIGMLVLFIGLSFLAKYVSSSGLFPLEARLAGLGLVGAFLLGFGWKTRERQQYGLVLQGGGLAVMYLTLFVAAKLYPVISLGSAFGMMLVVVMGATVLAVKQNAQVLSLIATAGGFLVPILTSDGGNNYVGLFSFYLLLNLGVLALAWFKSWRLLNVTGFIFTFVISLSWCFTRFTPADYLSVQPFLALFFFMYLALMVLFSMRQPPELKGLIDGSIMFGLPLIAFSQQIKIMQDIHNGDAYSALFFALIYAGLARFMAVRFAATHGLFIYTLQVIAAGFATLLIPILLDAQWTSVSFAIEAAGLIWIGFRQNRGFSRFSGFALYIIGCISLFSQDVGAGETLFISGDFLNLAILSAAAIFIARMLDRHAKGGELSLAPWLFYLGCLWWFAAGAMEIYGHFKLQFNPLMIIFISLSIAIADFAAGRLFWSRPATLPYALLPVAALMWAGQIIEQSEYGVWRNPFDLLGCFSAIVVFVLQYRWLKQRQIASSIHHTATAYVATALLVWLAAYAQQTWQFSDQNLSLLWFIVCALPVGIVWLLHQAKLWPVHNLSPLYLGALQLPWQVGLAGLFAYTAMLPHQLDLLSLPLLNVPDAVMAASGLVLGYFIWHWPQSRQYRSGIAASLLFAWLNTVLLRCMHLQFTIPYQIDELLSDARIQMALSVFWTLAATAIMLIASRLLRRTWWLAGLGLMAVVVAKLFLIDLADNGSLTRIISFLSVGAMMLLIGYFSPIPPKAVGSTEATSSH
jgi:uncharacterized membrane protein